MVGAQCAESSMPRASRRVAAARKPVTPQRVASACRTSTAPTQSAVEVPGAISVLAGRHGHVRGARSRTNRRPCVEVVGRDRLFEPAYVGRVGALGHGERLARREGAGRINEELDIGADRLPRRGDSRRRARVAANTSVLDPREAVCRPAAELARQLLERVRRESPASVASTPRRRGPRRWTERDPEEPSLEIPGGHVDRGDGRRRDTLFDPGCEQRARGQRTWRRREQGSPYEDQGRADDLDEASRRDVGVRVPETRVEHLPRARRPPAPSGPASVPSASGELVGISKAETRRREAFTVRPPRSPCAAREARPVPDSELNAGLGMPAMGTGEWTRRTERAGGPGRRRSRTAPWRRLSIDHPPVRSTTTGIPARSAASTSYGVSPSMASSPRGSPARAIAASTMFGSGFEAFTSLEVVSASMRIFDAPRPREVPIRRTRRTSRSRASSRAFASRPAESRAPRHARKRGGSSFAKCSFFCCRGPPGGRGGGVNTNSREELLREVHANRRAHALERHTDVLIRERAHVHGSVRVVVVDEGAVNVEDTFPRVTRSEWVMSTAPVPRKRRARGRSAHPWTALAVASRPRAGPGERRERRSLGRVRLGLRRSSASTPRDRCAGIRQEAIRPTRRRPRRVRGSGKSG